MSGERVDVLGIIDAEITRAGGEAYQAGRDLVEVRAAVAELIDADRKVDEVEAAIQAVRLAGPRPHSYGTGWELRDDAHRRELEGELEAAHKRRAVALSRIQPDGQG